MHDVRAIVDSKAVEAAAYARVAGSDRINILWERYFPARDTLDNALR